MSEQVYWILETAIKEGELENLKALMADMVAATEANEPGTLNYEWSISPDEKSCHIFERYVDSDATMVHMGNFQKNFAGRFVSILTPTRFEVYGAASDTVKKGLAPLGAVFNPSLGGFSR